MKSYLFNIVLSLDLLGSAITGGMPGETLSGRAGTAEREGKLRGRIFAPIIDWLFGNPRHCEDAIQHDIDRAKAVIADDTKA